MYLRRSFSYLVAFSLAAGPVGAQNTPPATKAAASNVQPNTAAPNISFDATETQDYARIILNWPTPDAASRANLNGALAIISLPSAINVDPIIFKTKAPNFIVGAALGQDKKTIRMALSKRVSIQRSRFGNSEVIDFVVEGTPAPPPYNGTLVSNLEPEIGSAIADDGKTHPLRNWPAPAGARRLNVEAAQSPGFTRVSISGPVLPTHIFARKGDRVAISLRGLFALDVAAIRASLPNRVKDAVRYNDRTHTSLVMDLEPGVVTRHGRQGDMVYIDIMPPDTKDGENKTEPSAEPKAAEAAKPPTAVNTNSNAHSNAPSDANPNAHSEANTSGLEASAAASSRPDPAPSGKVIVVVKEARPEVVLDFGFNSAAPAAIFRRGGNIFILFATKADFDVKGVNIATIGKVTPVKGDGLSGIKIAAPDSVIARPLAMGQHWLVSLSSQVPTATRNIEINAEIAPDESHRLKAIVPDAIAAGSFIDTDVGDKLLIGMALGPPSSLQQARAFLEASAPNTWHGIAIIPRSDDLDIRLAPDGFVIARPNGLALSSGTQIVSSGGMAMGAPGFVNFTNWRMGPQADFSRNLARIKMLAAAEVNDPAKGIKAQLDLARFYLAWELPQEALGVVKIIKAIKPDAIHDPQVLGLQGISQTMAGRGREGIETLSSAQIGEDAASQLWAAMAALISGDPIEARKRFSRGQAALSSFDAQYQGKFTLNEAISAFQTKDYSAARINAARAGELATDPATQEMAKLYAAQSLGELGQSQAAIADLEELEKSQNREIAARATYYKAILKVKNNPSLRAEAIRALDGLRYSWRGDDLELDILRNLGEIYIAAGDIRSGLATLADASTLRPELPAARALRELLAQEFRALFLEGGADGMDPVQALALFYDFRKLTPIGPEGDQMARGLADRLVGLDLLPQAAELLKYQVDNRLQGFTKSQVASDLAAVYLLDHKPEDALKTIWDSRIAQLPTELNDGRRLIEAIAMTELGRHDHALDMLEFDTSRDASKVRAEAYWRKGDYTNAAIAAKVGLPAPAPTLDPTSAGEVLRAVLAQSLSGDKVGALALAAPYKPAMDKSAYAEAFKVVTATQIPSATQLSAAIASVHGSSPFGNLVKDLRRRVALASNPNGQVQAAPTGPNSAPSDGNPQTKLVAQNTPAAQGASQIPKATARQLPARPKTVPKVVQNTASRQAVRSVPARRQSAQATAPRRPQTPQEPPVIGGR